MSASLVGSEMCIRDRLTGTHAQLGSVAVKRLGRGPCAYAGLLVWSKGGSCLLYTSDAADDM
eukprot:11321446-Alexandrium_andersonii.AAC.1